MMHIFITDQGRVRPYNEDTGGVVCNQDKQTLYVIADGMGGHNAGDVASAMVLQYFQTHWPKERQFTRVDDVERYLIKSIQTVNEQIYQKAKENDAYRGMGTTVVVVIIIDEMAVVAHVGDSRCYKLAEGQLRQITKDHSLVNALIHAGEITEQEARVHPKKNILTRAVGTDLAIDVDVTMVSCELGDTLLLCTDGLTNKLTDEEIKTIIQSVQKIDDAGKQLIDAANARGGEDNISLVLINEQAGGDASC
ncbi:protein phosphatase [Halolactibacillus halophilus]|uniref:protein-serine/threonine phosphatase n=2 Tax=Halolactibacillus halophilus TaxID=306540 RepID=A0A1I5LPD6_9BACI|nr:protein phosphatase [Halolactibacillus halophilus]